MHNFGRKTYVNVANHIKDMEPTPKIQSADLMAMIFSKDNPAFKPEVFYTACGISLEDRIDSYIDVSVLREAILDSILHAGATPNFSNAMSIWLDFLLDLNHDMDDSAKTLKELGGIS